MRQWALTLGASLLAVSLAAGCGDDGASDESRGASQADLSRLVLRAEDVPEEYRRSEDENAGLGLQHDDDSASTAQFSVQYELDADVAQSGDLSCVVSVSALYDTPEAALSGLEASGAEFLDLEFEVLDVPDIGTDARAYHHVSDSAVYCSGYENEPAEFYYVLFARSNTLGAVATSYRDRGGSIDAAVDYAKKQLATTDAALRD